MTDMAITIIMRQITLRFHNIFYGYSKSTSWAFRVNKSGNRQKGEVNIAQRLSIYPPQLYRSYRLLLLHRHVNNLACKLKIWGFLIVMWGLRMDAQSAHRACGRERCEVIQSPHQLLLVFTSDKSRIMSLHRSVATVLLRRWLPKVKGKKNSMTERIPNFTFSANIGRIFGNHPCPEKKVHK